MSTESLLAVGQYMQKEKASGAARLDAYANRWGANDARKMTYVA